MFSKISKKDHHHQPEKRLETQESEFTKEKEVELNRNLALSYYAHASHLDRLRSFEQALTDALSSRQYMSKVPKKPKDDTFRNTIEKKIDKLRSLVNNDKVFEENDMLLKSQAEINHSKLRSSNSNDLVKSHMEDPSQKQANLQQSRLNQREKAKFDSKSNFLVKNISSSDSKHTSKFYQGLKQKDAMPPVINSNPKPTGYNKITKDPTAKVNYDSLKFRVTPLYLHNEFFYGNYSNGVEMYRSTCNNRKYFPYEQLNPIPNDPNFVQKEKPAQLKQSRAVYKNDDLQNRVAVEKQPVEADLEDADLDEGLNEVMDDSFNSNPPEVIELNSPIWEMKHNPVSQKSKVRTQSAIEKMNSQDPRKINRPHTALSPSQEEAKRDSLHAGDNQKSRGKRVRSSHASGEF